MPLRENEIGCTEAVGDVARNAIASCAQATLMRAVTMASTEPEDHLDLILLSVPFKTRKIYGGDDLSEQMLQFEISELSEDWAKFWTGKGGGLKGMK